MQRGSRHDRLFRALLRLFPAEFRGDFGDDMAADFSDQRQAAAARRRLGRLWLRTAWDLMQRAPREHADGIRRDAGYALRVLARHPVSAATAIVSLAIGIGLNSAVYSVVGGVLWRSVPLAGSERLVIVGTATPSAPDPGVIVAATFLEVQRQARTLDAVAGAAFHSTTIVEPGEPAHVSCMAVTRQFFDLLGVKPVLGRGFTPADYEAALAARGSAIASHPTPSAVLLSDVLWRRQFAGDQSVVGTSMRVAGGERVNVVGVMGPELTAIGRALPGQCWFPDVPDASTGMWRPHIVVGRLAPGRSLAEANAELAIIGGDLGEDRVSTEKRSLRAVGLLDRLVGRVRTQLLFLFGAVVVVLLVTCANVTNLFLAHTAGRGDELATRVALGASRLRLIRQSLTEGLVVSLLGGALGFLLAVWGVPALVALAPPTIPRLEEIGVDWSTFAFTFAASTIIGVSCGLVTALPTRVRRTMFGAVQAGSPRASRFRHSVAVAEIALALMLAVAATLMVRTIQALESIDLGFDPGAVVSADLSVGASNFQRAQDLQAAIVERVKALPGVRAAGVGLGPLSGGGMFTGGAVLPGDPRTFDRISVDPVSPGYFEALGARLVAGRFFESRDAARSGPPVVIVNETAARTFWRGLDPIGRTLLVNNQEITVVGVIGDVRGGTLEEEPGLAIYPVSTQSRNFLAGSMMIRVDGDPAALVPAIRDIIRGTNRELPFRGVTPLQERLDEAMAPRLFVLRLVGLFSVLGLILAAVGVYGVLAEFVVQRVPEFGVRMACGATAADVLRLVLRHGVVVVAAGLAIGFAGAVAVRDVMSTMVYGVQTFDPTAYASASLVLLAGTLVACTLPARRASRLDPVVALRSE